MAHRAPARKQAARPRTLATPKSPAKPELETLNFKVKSQFKREFKGYAVSRGMTMVELLEASYQLFKEKHSG